MFNFDKFLSEIYLLVLCRASVIEDVIDFNARVGSLSLVFLAICTMYRIL